jgi:hypothetical protein
MTPVFVQPYRAIPDDADCIVISSGPLGPPPSFSVTIGKYVPAVAAVAATPQQSGPNLPDYVPATPGSPAVPEKLIGHVSLTVRMTQAQWNAWDDSVPDTDYIRACVLANLGLTEA